MARVRAAAEADTLIILDEPTAALNNAEVDELFELIVVLKKSGIPVLYVSHRLDEIPRICDRVEVLRDGKNVGGLDHENSVPDKIIPLLVGRQMGDLFPALPSVVDEVILKADDVSGKVARNVTLEVHSGEILGLTGAIGAGQRNFARIVFGADTGTGSVEVHGRRIRFGRPDDAVRAGVGYVSGDRVTDGLFPILPVWRNASVVKSDDLTTAGLLLPAVERKLGVELIQQFDVRTSSPNKVIGELSGGNQQKALLARWAAVKPKLLILDEPTLGVDVGARRGIYDQIVALAETGMAVLLVSADHAELQGMSHRVMVFTDGEVVAEMDGKDATEEAVLHARIPTENEKAAS